MDQAEALARVGQAVFQRRIDLGFGSQRALADAAGVSLTTAALLERGKTFPKLSKRALLEDALQWQRGTLETKLREEIQRDQQAPQAVAEKYTPTAPVAVTPAAPSSSTTPLTQNLVITKGLTDVAAACVSVLLNHPEDPGCRAAMRELDAQLFNLETLIAGSLPYAGELFNEVMSAITALHEQRTAIHRHGHQE